jgi:uncharacterized protein YjbJ (UPF0337 family)
MGAILDKLKGRLKRTQGAVTGDRMKEAEGHFDELKGKVKGKIEEVKKDIKRPPT